MDLFISNLFSDNPAQRFYFLAVVLVVVVSIVLHELAHGWVALYLGDQTPRVQGRMTGNPLVHMGPFSLVALAIAGFAWGQMPIDRSRLRGRYGETMVAAAGPAMNLLIALMTLTAMGILMRVWDLTWLPPAAALYGVFDGTDLSPLQQNALRLLAIAGTYNLLLMMFNLLPAPPLDGSHILADLSPKFGQFIGDPANHGVIMMMFIFAFGIACVLIGFCVRLMNGYVTTLMGG